MPALLSALLPDAYAKPRPALPEGHYLYNGGVVAVGKKARTLSWDGGAPEKVVVAGPNLVGTEESVTWYPFVAVVDRVYFARHVLVGDVLSTDEGRTFRWTEVGCEGEDAPTCEVLPDGRRVVDGMTLHRRAEGAWSTESVPAPRAPTPEAARAAQLVALVDDEVVAQWKKAAGLWYTWEGELTITADGWSQPGGSSYREVRPAAPCLLFGVDDSGVNELPFWSDGADLATYEVAVRRGDVVWACESGIAVRIEGPDCEGFSWMGENGWYADDRMCPEVPDAAAPATFRTTFPASRVEGVWAPESGMGTREREEEPTPPDPGLPPMTE